MTRPVRYLTVAVLFAIGFAVGLAVAFPTTIPFVWSP